MSLLVEAFLFEFSLADSLSENTLSIIKEPTGEFFVGFPYNFRAKDLNNLMERLIDSGFILPKDTISAFVEMETYDIVLCKDDKKFLQLVQPNYLYSIPSYGGD